MDKRSAIVLTIFGALLLAPALLMCTLSVLPMLWLWSEGASDKLGFAAMSLSDLTPLIGLFLMVWGIRNLLRAKALNA